MSSPDEGEDKRDQVPEGEGGEERGGEFPSDPQPIESAEDNSSSDKVVMAIEAPAAIETPEAPPALEALESLELLEPLEAPACPEESSREPQEPQEHEEPQEKEKNLEDEPCDDFESSLLEQLSAIEDGDVQMRLEGSPPKESTMELDPIAESHSLVDLDTENEDQEQPIIEGEPKSNHENNDIIQLDTSKADDAIQPDTSKSDDAIQPETSKSDDDKAVETPEPHLPIDETTTTPMNDEDLGPQETPKALEDHLINESENPQSMHEEEEEIETIGETPSEEPKMIKIAAVASLSSSDVKNKTFIESVKNANEESNSRDCNGSSSSSSPRSSDSAKKVVGIKLASFAGLGRNGIADTTPLSGHGKVSGCKQCSREIVDGNMDLLRWETMQFCNEACLRKYQNVFNECSSCKKAVTTPSVGKYCVRFGSDIKQFCSNICLENYKKGLKVCCYCQKDISSGEGFLAPIGDKGQFKDFCLQTCITKYEAYHLGKVKEKEVLPCAVCSDLKTVELELLVRDNSMTDNEIKTKTVKLCSNPCFSAYKFANSLDTSNCDFCSMPYDIHCSDNVIYFENYCNRFCSTSCQNVYVMKFRKIVPCQWCKVKKYNFDMIEKPNKKGSQLIYCSINCLNLHGFTRKPEVTKTTTIQQQQQSTWNGGNSIPIIQSVSSLAGDSMFPPSQPTEGPALPPDNLVANSTTQTMKEVIKEYIVKCPEDVSVRNKATLTKPYMQTKGVSCKPNTCTKSTQTEAPDPPCLFPVTVPFYMPVPLRMYSAPYPVPIAIPIPVPVPVFMPVKRNSFEGIKKTIQKLHSKLPSDPFEAELLAMAGAIADKVSHHSDSESDDDSSHTKATGEKDKLHGSSVAQNDCKKVEECTRSNDSTEVEDLEKEIAADKVVPKPLPPPTVEPSTNTQTNNNYSVGRNRSGLKRRASYDIENSGDKSNSSGSEPVRVVKRPTRGRPPKNKQARIEQRNSSTSTTTTATTTTTTATPNTTVNSKSNRDTSAAFNQTPKERPDSKHHLKFTYGVNAWKHWIVQKNLEFEKDGSTHGKYVKPFQTDLLKLRADELNYTLCMFVKEVKKPNGDSYAPDSVLYLTLGIQEYLFENGRIDNIFTDAYYEPFTSTLHEVVKDFKLPVNELGYFVTRIEEEHLWESKQLGCHTPQVLLNTLIYLNTKYFVLKTCDEHAKLSFTHIMKHWKKTMTPGKASQQRTVLLRYHPPLSKGRNEEKKCYEQHENTENPARCPVKYYEQYIAKCPESTKSRSDVFYLQPEKSCVADSPLWFSNDPLSTHQLDKMLQRLLMVREIQEHMLADASPSSSS